MADLEEHAIKRDKRFLFRMIVGMIIAVVGGILVWSWLAGEEVAGCAARGFGNVTESNAPPPL